MDGVLYHAEIVDREHGSDLLSVPELQAWLTSKKLHMQTAPAIQGFEFIQIEALLCAVERPFHTMAHEDAAALAEINPRVQADPRLVAVARWVLASDAHSAWRKRIDAAIAAKELTPLDFASKLPKEWEKPTPRPAAPYTPVNDTAEIADLFDPVHYHTLEKIFFTGQEGEWKRYADKAKANGLISARAKRGLFNPYLAGLWWLEKQHPQGWDLARIRRALAKALPDRSRGNEHVLTGELD